MEITGRITSFADAKASVAYSVPPLSCRYSNQSWASVSSLMQREQVALTSDCLPLMP